MTSVDPTTSTPAPTTDTTATPTVTPAPVTAPDATPTVTTAPVTAPDATPTVTATPVTTPDTETVDTDTPDKDSDLREAVRMLVAARKGTDYQGEEIDSVTGQLWADSPLSRL